MDEGGRSKFAGGDQAYLREEQYRDDSRLQRRTNLHLRYGTATVPWFVWVATRIDLRAGQRVLEVGCGSGALWQQAEVHIPEAVELTLCDLSPGMVAAATARATTRAELAVVEGREADLQALPFDDAHFDRVIANHMLYHLPDPPLGVAELARVVRPGGAAIVATNGSRHMRELHELEAQVFGSGLVDATIEVFGAEVGFGLLRQRFGDVRWMQYEDELTCSDPADVLDYACSSPPGEDATPEELKRLEAAIAERFAAGGGVMTISKDVGCFVCRSPRGGVTAVR